MIRVSRAFQTEQCWHAWGAGIVDGEGCIYLARPYGRKPWQIQLIVQNTDRAMLERLRELFGGTVRAGSARPASHKPIFRWALDGPRALSTLRSILPWLVTKRARAELGIEATSTHDVLRLTEIRARFDELNRRGSVA